MNTKLIVAMTATLILAACSHDSSSSGDGGGGGSGGGGTSSDPASIAARQQCDSTPKNPGTDIRYVISQTINGVTCTTGCVIFTSRSSYCSGLQSDGLNNNCARDVREQQYDEHCR